MNMGSFKGRYSMAGTARLAWHDAYTWHGWHDPLGTKFRFGLAWHGPARGHSDVYMPVSHELVSI